MRKLDILAAMFATAILAAPAMAQAGGRQLIGGSTAEEAVKMFMTGVQQHDSKTVGFVWGTRQTLTRDAVPTEEFDRRVFLMTCNLQSDSSRVVSSTKEADDRTGVVVRIATKTGSRVIRFRAVQGGGQRWFVESFDMKDLRSC